jgi:Spy/CpxP family protein refolding chaperone
MKKIAIVGSCALLGFALVATVALAWGPGFGPMFGRGFGRPAYGVPPIPDLTKEQSDQIQALRDAFLKEVEPLQKELYAKGTELRDLWSSPSPDPAAVTAKQKELASLQSELRQKATTLGLKIRKFLTPEQLAQLRTFGPGPGFGPHIGFGPGPSIGPGPGFGPRMGFRGPFGR